MAKGHKNGCSQQRTIFFQLLLEDKSYILLLKIKHASSSIFIKSLHYKHTPGIRYAVRHLLQYIGQVTTL